MTEGRGHKRFRPNVTNNDMRTIRQALYVIGVLVLAGLCLSWAALLLLTITPHVR